MPPPPLPSGAYWALGAYWLSGLWERPLPSPGIETGDQQHQEHGNSMEDDPLQGGKPQGTVCLVESELGRGGTTPFAVPRQQVPAGRRRHPKRSWQASSGGRTRRWRLQSISSPRRQGLAHGQQLVLACDRSPDGEERGQRTATRRLTFTVDDGAVAIVGTTLGAGDALAGVISRGASVTAVPTGLHTVTDGIGTNAAQHIGPPTRVVVSTHEGVSAFAARGFFCVARAWLANVTAPVKDTYCDSSVARPVVDSSYQIGATDAADFARNRRSPCRAGQTARLGATAVVSHGHNSAAAPFARNPAVNSRRRATPVLTAPHAAL